MSLKSAVLYCGYGSWDVWFGHFQNVAAVNNWDNAMKVLWLKARLSPSSNTAAFQGDYRRPIQALRRAMKQRFEPNCQTEMYWRKFQTRLKRSDEAWHDVADDLCGLVNKAIPHSGT